MLHNALMHARGSTITLEIKFEENDLVILVIDNGIGFNEQQKTRGMGMSNINSRTKKVKGEITFTTGSGGTSALFKMRLD